MRTLSSPAIARADVEPTDGFEFEYVCPDTGIAVRFGDDCRPLSLDIPAAHFARPRDVLAAFLVDAFNVGAYRCQAALDTDSADFDDADSPVFAGGNTPQHEFGAQLNGTDATTGHAEPSLDACMDRLHSVANLLTEAHRTLLDARSQGTDPDGLATAEANSAGAIVGLRLRAQFAAAGPRLAATAILSAAQNAVDAANEVRADVVHSALAAVLDKSLSRGRHGESTYL